jgi:hypothetical protein
MRPGQQRNFNAITATEKAPIGEIVLSWKVNPKTCSRWNAFGG